MQSPIRDDNGLPAIDAVGDAFTVSDAVHFDDHDEYDNESVSVGDRGISGDSNDVGKGDTVANSNAKGKRLRKNIT